MKLLRYGEIGKEKPGILGQNGKIRDLSNHITDINGDNISEEGLKKISMIDVSSLQIIPENTRLGACVGNIGKFLCIGLNYSDHAAETGAEVPSEPITFMKATSCINGPNDDIEIVSGSKKLDWEVELGIVIGKKTRYVTQEKALEHVVGYVLVNDISEREYQLERLGQWVKGKSCDTFAPLGPFMATTDEIQNPHNLRLWLKLNGKTMQDSNTSDLIFSIPKLVSYISEFMTLLPGDVISTGTPFGVGLGLDPQKYLKDGDVMELGIDGLGVSKQSVKEFK